MATTHPRHCITLTDEETPMQNGGFSAAC